MKVRTAQEIEEDRLRTLYIRLPHTIKNIDEIRDLIFGDANIKLPRQSGRHCHVIFPSIEEKVKNMKSLKKKLIDDKHIFVSNPKVRGTTDKCKKKIKARKPTAIEITEPEQEEKVSKICFIKNIPSSATVKDLKELFVNARNVAIIHKARLDPDSSRTGIVKFRDVKVARAYLSKQTPWPICKGVQLTIHRDTRKQNWKKKRENKKKKALKIYDGDVKKEEEEEVKSETESNDDDDEVKSEDDDDDDDDEEESEESEEEIKSESEDEKTE